MTASRRIGPMALLAMVLCATGSPSSGCDRGGGPDGDYAKPPSVSSPPAAGSSTAPDADYTEPPFVSSPSTAGSSTAPDADYTKPPFVEGAAFCADFNRDFVEAISEPLQNYIYAAQICGGDDFNRLYDGRLRRWVENELKDATDDELAAGLRERIQNSLSESRDYLRRRLPNLPDDKLLLAHICHLVHGHFQFANQTTPRRGPKELLELKTGDCSELADLCGLLVSLVNERPKVAMLVVHYDTDIGPFHASHAILSVNGLVIDPTINMILTKTFEQMKAMPPAQRFEALVTSGNVHLGYNRYLEPERRKVQIEQHNTDAGVLAFYYPWYLDGLSEPDSTITYRELPPQIRFAKAPGAKTKGTKAR